MRVAVVLISLLVVVFTAWGQPPAEDYRLELMGHIDTSAFPEVGVRFRILDKKGEPARELPQADIVIYEDGQEVHRIKPKILREVPGAAMLVLDTSGSMARQEKMAEAQRAAKVFCEQLNPTTECGLVLFHHETYHQIKPTKDRSPLLKQIRDSESFGGTACFDAVADALEMLNQQDRMHRQAIVVMTDGRDVNSKVKLDEVIELAKKRETPVHTIGLGEAGKQQPIRTVLVLDRSGSMADRGKINSLKKAAQRYVELLPEHKADTTIIAFNQNVPEAEEFTNDKARLRSQVESIKAQGDTALYAAMWEALETLNAAKAGLEGKAPRQALIVLSDGLDNRSRNHRPDEIAERAKQDGVRLFMLGLGTGREIDIPTLRNLAAATDGRFFHIESQDKLTEVFEELSIELHDDGIDEQALQRLSAATGGQYYHVRQIDKLQEAFSQLAATVDNTHSVKYISKRARHDGTARGIEIRLGSLATVQSGYATHGLLTPQSSTPLYLLGLVVLGGLFLLPLVWKR